MDEDTDVKNNGQECHKNKEKEFSINLHSKNKTVDMTYKMKKPRDVLS